MWVAPSCQTVWENWLGEGGTIRGGSLYADFALFARIPRAVYVLCAEERAHTHSPTRSRVLAYVCTAAAEAAAPQANSGARFLR